MKKDKITLEKLKESFNTAHKKVLEKNARQFKEVAEKNNIKVNYLTEMIFNMQNVMIMAEFEEAVLKELNVNE